jgi:hypothetical protein
MRFDSFTFHNLHMKILGSLCRSPACDWITRICEEERGRDALVSTREDDEK